MVAEVEASEERVAGVEKRVAEIRESVLATVEELRRAASSGDLVCPVCGEAAHEECREALRRQAGTCDVASREASRG